MDRKVEYIIQEAGPGNFLFHLSKGESREVVLFQNRSCSANFDIELGEGAVFDFYIVSLACSGKGTGMGKDVAVSGNRASAAELEPKSISNIFNVKLNHKDAACSLNGVYLVDGASNVTNRVEMNHNEGHCLSNQLFRGILWDSARSNFEGRIYVAPDAQKTQAYQANNNMVESSLAKAHTQPHLEIYADDVKCSHGATVGNKESGELFYMQSRGISLEKAKVMLKQAFVLGVLEKITDMELKEQLSQTILDSLR